MQLSLSGFLFEDDYRSQSLTFAAFCELARSSGYDGVELRRTQVNLQTPAGERRRLRRTAGDQGLRVTCLSARGMPSQGVQRDDFFAGYLELCRDLSCSLLKVGGEPEWLARAAEEALSSGVMLASNNHIGGDLETVAGTRVHLASAAHPNYGLLYDSLHLRLTGQDYLGCIPEFGARTKNVLVHSVRPAGDEEKAEIERDGAGWVKCLPDADGAQDWEAILGAFKRCGYDGLVTVIESGWPQPERERVARHCGDVLRRIWDA